jgi:hypothetical protein
MVTGMCLLWQQPLRRTLQHMFFSKLLHQIKVKHSVVITINV